MIYKEEKIGDATLRLYVLSNYSEIDINRRRAMVLICPGGGYHFCSNREAEAVAIRFNSMGYNAAVLFYSTAPFDSYDEITDSWAGLWPKPLEELAASVAYIRTNADDLNTDKDKIAVLGFSAGGHLAASIGVFWPEYGEISRPNALVLCYSVITSGPLAHEGSIRNLIGNREELREKVSLEKQVSGLTPPSFIWTTRTDHSVPYENSVMFRDALERFGVRNEFVLYEGSNGHGYSLGTDEVSSARHPGVISEVHDWPEKVDGFLVSVFGSKF